jgi:hypothetical protein
MIVASLVGGRIRPARAGLRGRLSPLAARSFALGASPYRMYCPRASGSAPLPATTEWGDE